MTENNTNEIRLDQFLKFHGVVQSGGEAKHLIQSGAVKVDDVVETRRGRKLEVGSVIEVSGAKYSVER